MFPKTIPAILLIVLLTISTLAQSGDSAIGYEFETAKVIMKKSVTNQMMETVTLDTIYIKDSGLIKATYSHETQNIKMLNQKTESRSLIILEQDWITNIDLDNKTGKKMKNPATKMFKGMTKNDAKKFAQNMANATNTDSKEIGTEKVAGVMCKVMLSETNMGGLKSTTKMWVYKNFNLKMESESMGTKVVEEAISFEENIKVPAKVFKVPNGIDVQVIDIKY